MTKSFYSNQGLIPRAALASEITTGGDAVIVVTGPCNGGYIVNPLLSAAQGIVTAEPLFVDPVGAPGSTDASGNGTTQELAPGASYAIPSLGPGVELKANAASSGHKFTAVVY